MDRRIFRLALLAELGLALLFFLNPSSDIKTSLAYLVIAVTIAAVVLYTVATDRPRDSSPENSS